VRCLVATVGGVLALAASNFVATTSLVATGFVAVTNGSGSLQISSFKLDGSGERRLTTGPANHQYPSVSPDGTQLLYTGDEGGLDEVYRLNLADPAVPVRLTNPPLMANSASWSPDGKSIVYSALVPGSPAYQIFIAYPDGTNPRQLTHTTDSGNAQPVFSPDGARVAYINGREATGSGPNGSTVSGIANRVWVVETDGSGAAPLTPGPLDAYPAWLDPGTILFARSSFLSQSSQVISETLDGREQPVSPPNQYFVEPRPLPDGRSYGATMESGTELHLVRISRVDRSTLTTPSTSEFVIDRLPIPVTDGSSFTIAWILGQTQVDRPARALPDAALPLMAAGVLVLILVGSASYSSGRKR
jgi:Tol biopolymer transport system component